MESQDVRRAITRIRDGFHGRSRWNAVAPKLIIVPERNPMKTLIDLSHTVEHGLVTYKGLPAPIVCDYLSREQSREHYSPGTTFQIGKIEMVANTGTYIDSPFHRYENGKDISELELEAIADIDGLVVRVGTDVTAIDESFFQNIDIRGRALLIHTDWARHWNTEQYFEGHPYLTETGAIYLRDQAVRLVGIDSHNIDDISDGTRPAHTVLLGADVPIVEHLCNLSAIPDSGFRFSAVPVKVKSFGTFPVRAFASLHA